MLKYFLTLLLFCYYSLSNAQFREIHPTSNYDIHIKGVQFFNPSTGFLALTNGVGFTQDSGHTYLSRIVTISNTNFNGYAPVNLTGGFTCSGVYAFSADSLLLYGHYFAEPSILFSANGGLNWKMVYHDNVNASNPDIYNQIFDMKFPAPTASTGFAVQHDKILRSTNRGQSWSAVGYASKLERLSFPSSTTGYAVGGNVLLKTTNSGISWGSSNLPISGTGFNYNNIFFLTNNVGYLSEGNNSRLYRTANGGFSWTKMNDEALIPINGSDLVFINDSTGFMCKEFLYQVYKTTDSGKIWEPCKKNINYQYLGYGFNRMQFLNSQIGWAGGAGEYLMLTTNGTPVLPKAFFKIDTLNNNPSYTVNLQNFSKPNYQYKWFRNDTLISTGYHTSYVHYGYPLTDTVKLIVSNGLDVDTAVMFQQFDPPQPSAIITSFNPAYGTGLSIITINGSNFTGVTGVRFGGVAAYYFQVFNNNIILAYVGLTGASGSITITKPGAFPTTVPGFTFFNAPAITGVSSFSSNSGSAITITGTNFNTVAGGNNVYFGAVKSDVLSASSNTLSVKVPAGASYAPISVTANTLTALSAKPFLAAFTSGTITAASFPARSNLATGTLPTCVIAADLDRDGKPDLIVANKTSNTVLVYRNTGTNGTISFATPITIVFSSTDKPSRVMAAEVDGDGKLDLAVTVTGGNDICIFLNTSTPGVISFAPKYTYSTTSEQYYDNPESIATEDMDGDGKIDFAVANLHTQYVSVILNRSIIGSPSLQRYDIPVYGQPISVGLKDMDGDSKPDMVVGINGFYSARVAIYRNITVRTYNTVSMASPVILTISPNSLCLADMDADGKPDLAVTDNTSGKMYIYPNTSSLGSLSFNPRIEIVCGTSPSGITAGDMDGDGRVDIAVANTGSNTVSIFKNISSIGTIAYTPKADVSTGSGPEGILMADLNGDSKPEIITTNTLSNNLSILKRSGIQALSLCQLTTSTNISSGVVGTTYQWQLHTGSGFTDITNSTNYSGTNSRVLQLNNMDNSWAGYQFRCVTDGVAGDTLTLQFTNTWTGAVSNAWETGGNWSCGVPPATGTDVYINAGTIIVNASVVIGSLNIAPGVQFTVKSNANIILTH